MKQKEKKKRTQSGLDVVRDLENESLGMLPPITLRRSQTIVYAIFSRIAI